MATITAAATGDRPPKASILARQLGLELSTVCKAMQRIQDAGGWYTPLTWGVCVHCGQPLASATGHIRRTHPQCRIAHQYHRLKARQADLPPDIAASRLDRKRAYGRKAAHNWWTRLSPGTKGRKFAPLAEAARSAQDETAAAATRRRAAWTPEEDHYILEHTGLPTRQLALDLSRTFFGICMRRSHLRATAQASRDIREPRFAANFCQPVERR